MEDLVYLECVKEGSKLRIKIISPGYHSTANCSFPKSIREENRKYSVPRSAVRFAEGPNHKFFYRISKSNIKIIGEDASLLLSQQTSKLEKVYENDSIDCIICMASEKDVVFANCGHYCACEGCAIKIKETSGKCPMCRTAISSIVLRNQIQI